MPNRTLLSRRHLLMTAGSVLWAGVGAQAAAPVQVEGVAFAGTTTVAGQALELNGVGLRAVAWLKGYAAGLYLSARARSAQQVLAASGAKRLQLRMLLDVDTEEFVKAFDKGVARNTPPAELARLAERMARFDALLRAIGKVKKRDVIDIDWLPGRGMQLALNDKPRGAPIPGEDLYAALLRIFVGERPTDQELKIGLLGGPVA
ncbi:MAG: chalcone isomerase family protein [Pseudomonadota bacterium]